MTAQPLRTVGHLAFDGLRDGLSQLLGRLGGRARAQGFTGYMFHDARQHWAVRMIQAGAPLQLLASQLGDKDTTTVPKVYGKYVPQDGERDRW
jgi:integrase